MDKIYDTNDNFNFDNLLLAKPVAMPGGNYFIRFLINNSHLYIQPPKCKTKQGITKAGKRFHTDLMFTNENDQFIRWMENLESHCQKYIYNNRHLWFEGEMEMHDIENYFTSSLKVYKSGKYYITRANISTILGKPTLKIYDENENEVEMENINENTNIITILEVQGIKCSARSFQIDIEVKQMMELKPANLFQKCIIKPVADVKSFEPIVAIDDKIVESQIYDKPVDIEPEFENTEPQIRIPEYLAETDGNNGSSSKENTEHSIVGELHDENRENLGIYIDTTIPNVDETTNDETTNDETTNDETTNELREIDFDIETIEDSIQIKKRTDVYLEMYREAKRKAKEAKDLALSAYLEAKRIKTTYMLEDDEEDSEEESHEEDSDLENGENINE